jgi:hypothetical protein
MNEEQNKFLKAFAKNLKSQETKKNTKANIDIFKKLTAITREFYLERSRLHSVKIVKVQLVHITQYRVAFSVFSLTKNKGKFNLQKLEMGWPIYLNMLATGITYACIAHQKSVFEMQFKGNYNECLLDVKNNIYKKQSLEEKIDFIYETYLEYKEIRKQREEEAHLYVV